MFQEQVFKFVSTNFDKQILNLKEMSKTHRKHQLHGL